MELSPFNTEKSRPDISLYIEFLKKKSLSVQ